MFKDVFMNYHFNKDKKIELTYVSSIQAVDN